MAITQNTFTGDGSTTNFSFTFPYLKTTDVNVSIDGVDTTAYSLSNATTVSFTTAPASGAAIRIYRNTVTDNLAATFYPGSAIRSSDLNDNFTQTLYVTQETDYNVDAAVTTANAASAAVAGAFFYTPIANLAALPSSPDNEDRVEMIDSTGIESSGVTGLPSGFTGSSALSVRIEYSSTSSAWVFKQYFATDPEARYYSKSSGESNASNIATNTSNISTNTSNISTNTTNIATNASDISTNTTNIASNATSISSNTTSIGTNTSNISTNTSNISTNTSNISTNTSDIATNTSNISTNTSNISTNATNIATKMPLAGGTFTGAVSFDDDLIVKGDSTNAGKLTLNCENNSHAVKIQGPAHSAAADYTLTLPTNTGNNGNSLITDGSGGLSWGSPTADVSNKADVDSPTFTGTPAAPTATQGTSTTQIATTAFVNAEIAADTVNLAPKASPTFTGIPVAPTASAGTNTTQVATTQFVTTAVNDKAPLLSPSLTGTPTAPTANSGTNTTQIATTAFVADAVSPKANTASPTFTGTPAAPTAALDTDTTQIATTAYVKAQIANDALSSVSPALTGTPTAPTAGQGTNTTQIATTAFVNAEIAADTADLAPKASPTFTGTPVAPTPSVGTNNTEIATTSYVQHEIGHTIQAYDADTTKNDVANTFTQDQTFDGGIQVDDHYYAVVRTSGSAIATQGTYHKRDFTSNSAATFSSFGTPPSTVAASFTLELKLGSTTITFPSSVKWAGGTAPTLTQNKTHLLFFVSSDGGTNWFGSAITDFTN